MSNVYLWSPDTKCASAHHASHTTVIVLVLQYSRQTSELDFDESSTNGVNFVDPYPVW